MCYEERACQLLKFSMSQEIKKRVSCSFDYWELSKILFDVLPENQSGFIYLLPKIVQSAKFEAKYFCDEKRLRPFLQRPPFKGCSGSKFHYRYSLQLFLSKSYSFHLFFSDRNNPGDFISGTGHCEKVLDLCQCYEAKFLFHKLKPNISSKFWASSSSMMAASYRKARFDH